MHGNCRRCGKEISTDSIYCEYCGIVVSDEKDIEPVEENKSKNTWEFLKWWIVSEKKIKYQADNYYKLRFRSYKAISALCLIISSALTSLSVFFGVMPRSSYIDVAFFLFLALFIYLGHRWALVAAMLLWTGEKGDMAYEAVLSAKPSLIFWQILWWGFFMNFFYKAFKVEQLRRKIFLEILTKKPVKAQEIIEDKGDSE